MSDYKCQNRELEKNYWLIQKIVNIFSWEKFICYKLEIQNSSFYKISTPYLLKKITEVKKSLLISKEFGDYAICEISRVKGF